MDDLIEEEIAKKEAQRDALFTVGTEDSYRRDRYERYDALTREIEELKTRLPTGSWNFNG